jgi:hypothetical protein
LRLIMQRNGNPTPTIIILVAGIAENVISNWKMLPAIVVNIANNVITTMSAYILCCPMCDYVWWTNSDQFCIRHWWLIAIWIRRCKCHILSDNISASHVITDNKNTTKMQSLCSAMRLSSPNVNVNVQPLLHSLLSSLLALCMHSLSKDYITFLHKYFYFHQSQN